jgi:hypothetical protein
LPFLTRLLINLYQEWMFVRRKKKEEEEEEKKT